MKGYMQATIFKPTKSSMQSGTNNSNNWLLTFQHDGSRAIEPVMGWTSSSDTLQEVNLKFSSQKQAIDFALSNELDYEIIEPQQKKPIIRPYASNFK